MGQRLVDHRDNAEQHHHLHDHRQTAAGQADTFLFIELHLLLLELLLILRIFFLQAFQAGSKLGPVGLAFLRF